MRIDLTHLTAPRRNKPSRPARLLHKLAKGRILDFGCGFGFDANHFGWEKYDKHYFPKLPTGKFDTIFCHYVLNVIDSEEKRLLVLNRIKQLLAKNGKAYITVRRDKKCLTGYRPRGTFQCYVMLNLPVIKENSEFCIYLMKK